MILERIAGSRFSRVVRAWEGQTAVILGGGPSLTGYQIDAVWAAHARGLVRCVAVNDAYLLAAFADVHYAADSHWHQWHTDGIAKPKLGFTAAHVRERWAGFAGQKCTIENSGANVTDAAVHRLRNKHGPTMHAMGLSDDPEALITGHNSGFQAMNLAVLAGAETIILLGFDGAPAEDGETHFHGGHPRPTPTDAYPLYRQSMTAARSGLRAAGVRVVNCSPGSKIDAFERGVLEDMLAAEYA